MWLSYFSSNTISEVILGGNDRETAQGQDHSHTVNDGRRHWAWGPTPGSRFLITNFVFPMLLMLYA
jgi:hypothetical protein